jgi:predicted ArsR family transcriptional regulator
VKRERASVAEREYFQRVAAASAALADESPPASLAETFERLERIRVELGVLAEAGVDGEDEDELRSHLRLYELARLRGA